MSEFNDGLTRHEVNPEEETRREEDIVETSMDYKEALDHELLSKEEEQQLGSIIQRGQRAKERLKNGGHLMSVEKRKEQEEEVARGIEARNSLVLHNLKLVEYFLGRTYHPKDWEKVRNAGLIGLIKAAERFNPNRETRFSTYAQYWILFHMNAEYSEMRFFGIKVPRGQYQTYKQYIRTEKRFIQQENRVPTNQELAKLLGVQEDTLTGIRRAVDMESFNAHPSEEEPFEYRGMIGDQINEIEYYEQNEITDQMSQDVMKLLADAIEDDRDRLIVAEYLGSDRTTLKDVGIQYGLSRERVRQIVKREIPRLYVAAMRRGLAELIWARS